MFFWSIFHETFSTPKSLLKTMILPTTNNQPIFLLIQSENSPPTVRRKRSQHFHCRPLDHHDSSKNDFKNIIKIGDNTFIWILIKSTCAVALMHKNMIKTIIIWHGFCIYFSHYNKIRYQWRWKSLIFDSFCCNRHDSSRIGSTDPTSVLRDV